MPCHAPTSSEPFRPSRAPSPEVREILAELRMRRAWLAPRVEAGEAGAGPALVNLDVLIAWALALSEVGAGRDRGEPGCPPAGA